MRKSFTIPLAIFVLALLAGSAMAQTDSQIRFGIRPTEAYEDRPETFTYFSYQLAPGEVLTDAALILNSGFVPVSLHLYAADGFTAVNTGTAFTLKGEDALGQSVGTRRWLSFSDTDFRLEGAEEVIVPFTVTVPLDATPGHHVAGLVVKAPPKGEGSSVGEDEGQFAAIVVQQAGVAVVIDVPGPHIAGLEIISTCMKTQGDLGATFVIGVRNTGNIMLKAEGSLSVMDLNETELASVPLEMGTVLPGDTTTFQVDHPVRLGDGGYLLSDVLNYEGKTATLEGIELRVKDGQPEVGCDAEEEAEPPASIIGTITPFGGGGSFLVWIAILGGAALALALIILFIIRRRRARGGGPDQPPRWKPPSGPTGGPDGPPGEAPRPKTGEGTSETPSLTNFVPALIRRRRAGGAEPDPLSPPRPPFSSIDGANETPGEAQPPKVVERASEQPSFTKFVSALIRRLKAGVGGPNGSPGEAQPPMTVESPSEQPSFTNFRSALIRRLRAGVGGPDGSPGQARPRKRVESTSEQPSFTKFVPVQLSERGDSDLPVFLNKQLQRRTKPAERPAAGEHRGPAPEQETDLEEQQEELRAA